MKNTLKRSIIESWFYIDYTLFKTEPKKELSESEYKDYLVSKGAFLSNLFEMYGILRYIPKDVCYNNFSEMQDYIEDNISTSKDEILTIMREDSSIKSLREEVLGLGNISGINETDLSTYVAGKRQKAMILDNILLSNAVANTDKNILESWKFRVLFDSHKIFRDSLIDVQYKDIVSKIKNS